jgi:GRAB domain
LSSELNLTNSESERVTKELDSLRLTLQQQQQSSSLALSTEISSMTLESQSLREQLREKEDLLERGKLEKEEWERILMEERVAAETLRGQNRTLRREFDNERMARRRFEKDWEEEQTRANNLESVLAEFEAGQQSSISSIKETYTSQIDNLTQSLAEYKSRALNAELELQEGKSSSDRVNQLEKQLKEKDILLTKVRSEAVTLNEHLIQALRRLRKFSADPSGSTASSSSPSYVDRRLVTNILLQFLTTARADRKRFEMLNLLGSILGWGDEERERAGLQRGTGSGGGASPISTGTPKLKGKSGDDDRGDEVGVHVTVI